MHSFLGSYLYNVRAESNLETISTHPSVEVVRHVMMLLENKVDIGKTSSFRAFLITIIAYRTD